MTNVPTYDGTGRLADALADLYGFSPKNHNRIAGLIAQAKAALEITIKAKTPPPDVRLAIYQWHHDRLHPMPSDAVEIISQPASASGVNIFSQADSQSVNIVSQPQQVESVKIIAQHADSASVRIAFRTTANGARTRQVVALDGFYVNALMLATGIAKQQVPKWVQQAVDAWADFDPKQPITRQVKLLLVRALTEEIARLRAAIPNG